MDSKVREGYLDKFVTKLRSEALVELGKIGSKNYSTKRIAYTKALRLTKA